MKTFTRKRLALAATLSAILTIAGCGNLSHEVAQDGSGAKELVWPKPADTNALHKGGTFPNLDNLRDVQSGLSKNQVMALIGEPHFGEGIGVREWTYLFNFRAADGQVTQCEYKVLFDKDAIARSFHWNPASCADVLKPAAAPAPASAAAAEAPAVQHVVLWADALFAFDKSELSDIKPAGRRQLNSIVKELAAEGHRSDEVRITGYTDRLGSAAYNQRLSEQRAQTVRSYLISRGVAPERITAEGRGASDPVADCHDRSHEALVQCLAPNRRVTVDLVTRRQGS